MRPTAGNDFQIDRRLRGMRREQLHDPPQINRAPPRRDPLDLRALIVEPDPGIAQVGRYRQRRKNFCGVDGILGGIQRIPGIEADPHVR